MLYANVRRRWFRIAESQSISVIFRFYTNFSNVNTTTPYGWWEASGVFFFKYTRTFLRNDAWENRKALFASCRSPRSPSMTGQRARPVAWTVRRRTAAWSLVFWKRFSVCLWLSVRLTWFWRISGRSRWDRRLRLLREKNKRKRHDIRQAAFRIAYYLQNID